MAFQWRYKRLLYVTVVGNSGSCWNDRRLGVVWPWNMSGGDDFSGAEHMLLLIVKKDMRAECLQDWPLMEYAYEMGFVRRCAPGPQGVNNSSVGWRVASRDNRNTNFAHTL